MGTVFLIPLATTPRMGAPGPALGGAAPLPSESRLTESADSEDHRMARAALTATLGRGPSRRGGWPGWVVTDKGRSAVALGRAPSTRRCGGWVATGKGGPLQSAAAAPL